MQVFKFKTNINCGNCIKRVTPFIEKINGVDKWEVDIDNPDKVLTVETGSATKQDVIDAIRKIGFEIESID